MKKRVSLTLAWLLVSVHILFAGLAIPAAAAPQGRSYTAYQATEAVTIDGVANDAAWANVPWSEAFVCSSGTANPDFVGRAKLIWMPKDESTAVLYALIEVVGDTTVSTLTNWAGDSVFITGLDRSNHVFWTGAQPIKSGIKNNQTNDRGTFSIGIVDDRANPENRYTVECCYEVAVGIPLTFDVWVQDNTAPDGTSQTPRARYSWNGIVSGGANEAPQGAVTLSPIKTSELLAPMLTPGASIRLDTTEPDKSGIRFAASVDVTRYNALRASGAEITVGTLLVPAEKLTSIPALRSGYITEGALTAAGLEADKNYYNIVNADGSWVTDKPGTWYGTLFNVKNFARSFIGIGYVTVAFPDGTGYTLYGEYRAGNARSVAQVAQLAIDSGIYSEETTPAEWALLQGFIRGGNTQ